MTRSDSAQPALSEFAEPQPATLTETPATCPLCTHPVDEVGIQGLNAQVCLPCTENIHCYTPTAARLHTEELVATVWVCVAARDWNSDVDPVFLGRPGCEPSQAGATVEALSEQTQTTLRALATSHTLTDVEHLVPVEYTSLWEAAIAEFDPFKRTTETIEDYSLKRLRDDLPHPSVFFGDRVYTVDPEALTTAFEEPTSGQQATVGAQGQLGTWEN